MSGADAGGNISELTVLEIIAPDDLPTEPLRTLASQSRPVHLLAFVSELKILTKERGVVRLGDVMNYAQRDLVTECERQLTTNGQIRVIALKARQIGISTVIEAVIFALSILFRDFHSLIISHEKESAEGLLSMTKRYWATYPFREFHSEKYNGKNHLAWADRGSEIQVATAKNVDAGRSKTIQAVHASECAFWDDPETLMTGLRQSIPTFGLTAIFLESTANGIGNYFHKTWNLAAKGLSEFAPLFFPWWKHPEYTAAYVPEAERGKYVLELLDEEERALRNRGVADERLVWRRWAIVNLCQSDLSKFHQEYPACVLPGTRIATSRGLLPVEQVLEGDMTPYGKVEAVHAQPATRCVRITTRSGLQLDATWHHPMVVGEILVPAEATQGLTLTLAEMDFANEPATHEWCDGLVRHSVEMTDELALFAGYFMGDGYFSDGAISIVGDGQDADVTAECESLFRAIGVTPHARVVGSKGGGVEVRGHAIHLKAPFRELGFTRTLPDRGQVRDVHVPEIIWRSTREHVRLFLAGLYEADGFNNKAQWDVRLFTCHEAFARDVQRLLLGFGLHANVRGKGKAWEVCLAGLEAQKFHAAIGFRSARKRANVPTTKPGKMRGNRLEVVSVEPLGDHPSYDLSIEGRPYFGANGLLTHNSPHEAFVSTGRNVFPMKQLVAHYEPARGVRGQLLEVNGKLQFHEDENGPLTVFSYPSADKEWGVYLIGADPTHSAAGDWACAQVLNRRTLEVVATYRRKLNPVDFGHELRRLGYYYNTALVAPEKTGPGYATVGALLTANYPFVWESAKFDRTPGALTGDTYGWGTNRQTKVFAISHLLKAFMDKVELVGGQRYGLLVHDAATMAELRDYITTEDGQGYKNGDGSWFDDGVMALAIAVTVHDMEPPVPAHEVMAEDYARAPRLRVVEKLVKPVTSSVPVASVGVDPLRVTDAAEVVAEVNKPPTRPDSAPWEDWEDDD